MQTDSKKDNRKNSVLTCYPLDDKKFIIGEIKNIRQTKIDPLSNIADTIQKEWIGLSLPTIFSNQNTGKKYLGLPRGCRMALLQDLVLVLKEAKKDNAALELQRRSDSDLDLYVFRPEVFEYVE